MTNQVNVRDAKTHFSQLLRRVEQGEEVVIARRGRPVARLITPDVQRQTRTPGVWRGQIWTADDFDETPDDYQVPVLPAEG